MKKRKIDDVKQSFDLLTQSEQKEITGGSLPDNINLPEVVIYGGTISGNGTFGNVAGFFGGIAEATLAIMALPETGGASAFLVFDGLLRAGLYSGNQITGRDVPTNFGELIGSNWGPSGQLYGGMTDDALAALMGGGITGDLSAFKAALSGGDPAVAALNLYDAGMGTGSIVNAMGSMMPSFDVGGAGGGWTPGFLGDQLDLLNREFGEEASPNVFN